MLSKELNLKQKKEKTIMKLKITVNKADLEYFDKLSDVKKEVVDTMEKREQIAFFTSTMQERELTLSNAIADKKASDEITASLSQADKDEKAKSAHLESKVQAWCKQHNIDRIVLTDLQYLLISTTPEILPKVVFSKAFTACVYELSEKDAPKSIKRKIAKEKEKKKLAWQASWKKVVMSFADEIKQASNKYVKAFVQAFEESPEVLDTKSFSHESLSNEIEFNGNRFKVSIAVNVKPIYEKE